MSPSVHSQTAATATGAVSQSSGTSTAVNAERGYNGAGVPKPSQMETRYVNMLLAVDDIPRIHTLLAAFFTWILLAGFILFPGTFTSLQNAGPGVAGEVSKKVLTAVNHVPLFVIAFICCGIGAIGMAWLSWRWRHNYIWIVNKIYLPGALNSFAGLLSTISNVFGAQHGELSTTSKTTVIVTACAFFITGVLMAFYSLWLLRKVKKEHDKTVGVEKAGKHGEGVVVDYQSKAQRAQRQQGMLV